MMDLLWKVKKHVLKVPVVDTVGAGDGFAAGVISATLEGLDDKKILERGNAIGAMQVMNLSDNEAFQRSMD